MRSALAIATFIASELSRLNIDLSDLAEHNSRKTIDFSSSTFQWPEAAKDQAQEGHQALKTRPQKSSVRFGKRQQPSA